MNIETLKQILELGWPAIITVMFGYLAMQYIADQRRQIDTLWERVKALEAEIMEVKRGLLADHLKRDDQP